MGRLTDLLREENHDAEAAALAAAAGRSMTGFSGHHSDLNTPIAGERTQSLRPGGAAPLPPDAGARKRVPFGLQAPSMTRADRPGFFRHWFNDSRDRIEKAQLGGYTHVMNAKGEPISAISGRDETGRGQKSYLMEIPIEWYREDLAAQDAALEDRLAEIRHGRSGPGASDNRYVPKQGITYRSGTGRPV